MTQLFLIAAVVLVVCLALGLTRVALGPTACDSMLAAQLLSTIGVGLLALFAMVLETTALVDVALVLSLLAAVAAIAFVRSGAEGDEP